MALMAAAAALCSLRHLTLVISQPASSQRRAVEAACVTEGILHAAYEMLAEQGIAMLRHRLFPKLALTLLAQALGWMRDAPADVCSPRLNSQRPPGVSQPMADRSQHSTTSPTQACSRHVWDLDPSAESIIPMAPDLENQVNEMQGGNQKGAADTTQEARQSASTPTAAMPLAPASDAGANTPNKIDVSADNTPALSPPADSPRRSSQQNCESTAGKSSPGADSRTGPSPSAAGAMASTADADALRVRLEGAIAQCLFFVYGVELPNRATPWGGDLQARHAMVQQTQQA